MEGNVVDDSFAILLPSQSLFFIGRFASYGRVLMLDPPSGRSRDAPVASRDPLSFL